MPPPVDQVSLMGISNTYSIDRAKLHLGYAPGPSSDQLRKTVDFLKGQIQREEVEERGGRAAKWFRARGWLLLGTILEITERGKTQFGDPN